MRVLFAFDGNEQAAQIALKHSCALGAHLSVLFIQDTTWDVFIGHDWLSTARAKGDFFDWIEGEEAHEVQRIKEQFAKLAEGIPYTEELGAGDIMDTVREKVVAGKYDLLILPHPFLRGLERVHKRAKRLLDDLPCSTLFIKSETPKKPRF